MSRTMSPMMVAEYKLQLPDKTVLQKKIAGINQYAFVGGINIILSRRCSEE